MDDCWCDYNDPPVFYRVTKPRARQDYHCYECGGRIAPGERYERTVAKWQEDRYNISIILTCERCYDLRVWVRNNVPCLCVMHGNMDDEMKEAVDYAYEKARDEVIGLRFGFLRRLIMRDRHNKASG